MFKFGDIIFYLGIVLIGIYIYLPSDVVESKIVEVVYNGAVVENLDSSIDSIYYFEDINYNFTLLVENGDVSVLHSNCKDKLCTKIDPIKMGEQSTIICLPQKIVIRFKESDDRESLDGIAG